MILHLIGSLREFETDLHFMKVITSTIRQYNGEIALDWTKAAESRMKREHFNEEVFDWPAIIEANIQAIKHSNGVIVEGSRFNYSQGYQTALALQYGKPVLNLYREDLPEYKEWPDKLFVSGISSPLFNNHPYKTTEDLTKIVSNFLDDITPNTKELDLKLTLPTHIYDDLDTLSKNSGRSKTSLIKEILERGLSSS